MPVGFLCGLEIMQNAQGVIVRSCRKQSAGVLDQIARPDQVVPAKILIALVESPWNGKAGDDSAQEIFGFMRAQNGGAGAI